VGGAGGKVGGTGGKVSGSVLISSKDCENENICPLSYQTGMFSAKCFDSEILACLIKSAMNPLLLSCDFLFDITGQLLQIVTC